MLINRLLDLDRCKYKFLVEICFYSDTEPKLLLNQESISEDIDVDLFSYERSFVRMFASMILLQKL